MNRELNKPIAVKNFALLVLDYEWPADEWSAAGVSCRVIIDGWLRGRIIAGNREQAIEQFNKGSWRG